MRGIEIIMNAKDAPNYDLEKIPDSAVIKQLRFELGVLKSENDELRYEISIKHHPQAKNSTHIKSMEGQIRNLKAKLSNHVDVDQSELINKLSHRLTLANRQIEILQAELIKRAKNDKA